MLGKEWRQLAVPSHLVTLAQQAAEAWAQIAAATKDRQARGETPITGAIAPPKATIVPGDRAAIGSRAAGASAEAQERQGQV
jgi:hypothetical protein